MGARAIEARSFHLTARMANRVYSEERARSVGENENINI